MNIVGIGTSFKEQKYLPCSWTGRSFYAKRNLHLKMQKQLCMNISMSVQTTMARYKGQTGSPRDYKIKGWGVETQRIEICILINCSLFVIGYYQFGSFNFNWNEEYFTFAPNYFNSPWLTEFLPPPQCTVVQYGGP